MTDLSDKLRRQAHLEGATKAALLLDAAEAITSRDQRIKEGIPLEVLRKHWLYDVSTSAYNPGDEWVFVCACGGWTYEVELTKGGPGEGWEAYLQHLLAEKDG